jgi:ElaB/YqjD/DUF883 family membrane-anchored ribosome-binding protein
MTDSASAFSDSPDASSAADDLRAAAAGKTPKRPTSQNEKKALALKEAAAEKAAKLREFAGEKAGDLKVAATEKIEAIREGAGETAGQLREVAADRWDDTRERALELHQSMEDYVRENPTKSVLTAVGVGFVIGLLVRR